MSKKQREKVEDEVRRYQAQIRVQTDATPDSVYDAQQQPSSSDQFHGHYNGWVAEILIYLGLHRALQNAILFYSNVDYIGAVNLNKYYWIT